MYIKIKKLFFIVLKFRKQLGILLYILENIECFKYFEGSIYHDKLEMIIAILQVIVFILDIVSLFVLKDNSIY